MPKLSPEGDTILSAGEIGAYTVCPESWRLKYLARVTPENSGSARESVKAGDELHRAWVANYDEAMMLSRNAKLVIALILLAIAMYLIVHRG